MKMYKPLIYNESSHRWEVNYPNKADHDEVLEWFENTFSNDDKEYWCSWTTNGTRFSIFREKIAVMYNLRWL